MEEKYLEPEDWSARGGTRTQAVIDHPFGSVNGRRGQPLSHVYVGLKLNPE